MPTETDMEIGNVTVDVRSHTGKKHTLHVKADQDCTLILMKETRRITLKPGKTDYQLQQGEEHWKVIDTEDNLVGQDPPVLP